VVSLGIFVCTKLILFFIFFSLNKSESVSVYLPICTFKEQINGFFLVFFSFCKKKVSTVKHVATDSKTYLPTPINPIKCICHKMLHLCLFMMDDLCKLYAYQILLCNQVI
jgi:hypothetical protein